MHVNLLLFSCWVAGTLCLVFFQSSKKKIIYVFIAAEINAVENELSSIWGADSPGWEVVGDENLGPKNRSYKYQVDYFAVSYHNHITLLRSLSPIACSKYKVRFPQ